MAKKFTKYPSSNITGAEQPKMWVANLPEDKQLHKLNIPASEVRAIILQDVVDDNDRIILQHLIDEKAIPTAITSPDMRNNPYYSLDDKLISFVTSDEISRTYSIPYPGSGRFGSGKIYSKNIKVYDDGNIQIGEGKIRDPYALKGNTLRTAFYRD